MIIGRGLIGTALNKIDSNKYVFFASGVSNSKSHNPKEFIREKELLEKTLQENNGKCFIYFSTTSIDDRSVNSSYYTDHKLEVERYLEKNVRSYLIIRTGNIVGEKGNSSTIFNFLVNNIKNSIPFVLWENSHRNFLDVDDFIKMVDVACNRLQKHNEVISLVNPADIKIKHLVSIIEEYFNKKGIYTSENKGSQFLVDKSLSINIFTILDLVKENYELKLIEKYF